MSAVYHVVETSPGLYLVCAGEVTREPLRARHYTSERGASVGLGMARKWMGALNDARVLPLEQARKEHRARCAPRRVW